MRLRLSCIWLIFIVLPALCYGVDYPRQNLSRIHSKHLTLTTGLGVVGFARERGLSGREGIGFRVGAGHHFNRYLQVELVYQFSSFKLDSPDPIFVGTTLNKRAGMNQQYIRLLAMYPSHWIAPYVFAGFGGYNLVGISRQTGLSFPLDMLIPVGVGVRAYVWKNILSIDVDLGYQWLVGENQDAETLTLLGVDRVQFDTFSAIASATFHLF